jgi:hypothetical protein
MARAYITAFPDVRGQRYERTLITETSASPLDTAGDIHGETGTARRYRYSLGWDFLSTEEAVDIEHAVMLCADGDGLVLPFVEWETSDELDYPGSVFALWPGRWDGVVDPFTGPFHWWGFDTSLAKVRLVIGGTPLAATFSIPGSWTGVLPTFSVTKAVLNAAGAGVGSNIYSSTGPNARRIRLVTVESGSYSIDKSPMIHAPVSPFNSTETWSVSVALVEKESGNAPGYAIS